MPMYVHEQIRLDSLYQWAVRKKLGTTGPIDNDAKRLIENCFIEEVRQLLEECGQDRPPVDLDPLAKARRVIDVKKSDLQSDGLLTPVPEGFIITLKQTVSQRMRLTLAHEIAHTFFFDLNISPPRLAYDSFLSRSWVEEDLCRQMAREMLMPRKLFEDYVKQSELLYPSFDSLQKLASVFDASIQVVIKRIQDLDLWDVLFILSSQDLADPRDDLRKSTKVVGSGRFRIAGLGADIGHSREFINHLKDARKNGISTCRLGLKKMRGEVSIESRVLGKEVLSVCSNR